MSTCPQCARWVISANLSPPELPLLTLLPSYQLQWLPSWHSLLSSLYSSIREQGGIFYLLPLLLCSFDSLFMPSMSSSSFLSYYYHIDIVEKFSFLSFDFHFFLGMETWAKCKSCVLDVLYFDISASFCALSRNFSHTWYSFVSGDMRRYRTGRCYKSCWPGLGWEIMNGGRGKHFKMAENIFWLQEIKKIQSRH